MLHRSLTINSPVDTLTVREHFACQIMAGLVARDVPGTPDDWAEAAVWYADALIEELNFRDHGGQSS